MRGYVSVVVLLFLIVLAAIVYPWKFPDLSTACPEKPTNEESVTSELTLPAIQGENGRGPDLDVPAKKYRLVRKEVKINKFVDGGTSGVEYFQPSSDHTIFYEKKVINGKNYLIYYPSTYGEIDVELGYGDRVKDGVDQIIVRAQRMLYFVLADENFQPKVFQGKDQTGSDFDYLLVDFYKLTNGPMYPLKEGALCSKPLKSVQVPKQKESTDSNQLQLEWFLFGEAYGFRAHCKPAIYLYPKEKTLVNVKVYPKGNFTYVDPKYDQIRGWLATAYPTGQLSVDGKDYKYLYYEASISDFEIDKPEKGFVVKKEEIGLLLSELLPKLGLNKAESEEFISYWIKTLPQSAYYFVGIMDKENLDYIEPLDVNPKPDTVIRVSLYFEALDEFKIVKKPQILTPKREGYVLVEWGGLIKLHKNTPFTCSQ